MNIVRKVVDKGKRLKQNISRVLFGDRIAKVFSGDAASYFDAVYTLNPDIYGDQHHHLLENIIPNLVPHSKILDVGCGKGRDSIRLAEQGFSSIIAIDPSIVGVGDFREKIPYTIEDKITIYNLSASDYIYQNKQEKFDLISCANSLQYELQREQSIKDFQSMTNSGGYHMIMGPVFEDSTWKKLDQVIINDLYSDRTIIRSEVINLKRGNHDRPRLHFIAQKK